MQPMLDEARYYLWLVGRWGVFAWRAVGFRGASIPLGAAIVGFLSQLAGVRVTYADGLTGALAQACLAAVVAWLALFAINLVSAPWRIWRDGKWYGDRFVYDSPRLAHTIFVGPADNNQPHTFRFPDAPPNSFIWCKVEIGIMSLTNVDIRCQPFQLIKYQEVSNHGSSEIGVRVDAKRNLAMTTFVRSDASPRAVTIYVTGWERRGKHPK